VRDVPLRQCRCRHGYWRYRLRHGSPQRCKCRRVGCRYGLVCVWSWCGHQCQICNPNITDPCVTIQVAASFAHAVRMTAVSVASMGQQCIVRQCPVSSQVLSPPASSPDRHAHCLLCCRAPPEPGRSLVRCFCFSSQRGQRRQCRVSCILWCAHNWEFTTASV
jgi:hypothetical protein